MRLRAGLALLLLPLLAMQSALGADIEVKSVWVNVRDAVFELNARTEFPLDARVQAALDAGATINFDLQAVVEEENRYWFDNTLVDVVLRRALSWNALAQRYVLHDLRSDEQSSFTSLEDALLAAGEVIDWPIAVEPQLDPKSTYRIRVRAGYRRGSLPRSLRALVPWSDGWNRRSDWNAWTLPR
jgi:hypothetical protein